MSSFAGFNNFFVNDLLKRAKICLKKSTETENYSLDLEKLRESDDLDWHALDPKSLAFFGRFIFDEGLVDET